MNTHPDIRKYIANGEIEGELEDAFTEGTVTLKVGTHLDENPAPVQRLVHESDGRIKETNEDLRLLTLEGPTGLMRALVELPVVDQLEPATEGDLYFDRYESFVAEPYTRTTTYLDASATFDVLDGVLYHLKNASENTSEFHREAEAARIYLNRLTREFGIDDVAADPYLETAFEDGKWITIVLTFDTEQNRGNLSIEPRAIGETTVDDIRDYLDSYPTDATIYLSFKVENNSLEFKKRLEGDANESRLNRNAAEE